MLVMPWESHLQCAPKKTKYHQGQSSWRCREQHVCMCRLFCVSHTIAPPPSPGAFSHFLKMKTCGNQTTSDDADGGRPWAMHRHRHSTHRVACWQCREIRFGVCPRNYKFNTCDHEMDAQETLPGCCCPEAWNSNTKGNGGNGQGNT